MTFKTCVLRRFTLVLHSWKWAGNVLILSTPVLPTSKSLVVILKKVVTFGSRWGVPQTQAKSAYVVSQGYANPSKTVPM